MFKMTYLSFLFLFIMVPLLFNVLYLVYRYYSYKTIGKPNDLSRIRTYLSAILILTIIALLYTTPWDNFLVANRIWYYDTAKVLGIVIGYVPLEEYSFFVLQTFFVGCFTITFFGNNLSSNYVDTRDRKIIRSLSFILLFLLWMASIITYICQINSLIYLNLILIWALPPIMFQLLYGADILWEKKRPLILTIILPTSYLSIIDALAISANIWTITLTTSTGILLGGMLPIEELLFFLVTNVLIVFGLTLIVSPKSIIRFRGYFNRIKRNLNLREK